MSTFRDLDLTLAAHPGTKDIMKKVDVDAVKASMKNVLLSGPFDSPFDPNYGANIRGLLMESLSPSTAAVAKRRIILALNEYEPRAVIEDFYIAENGDNGLDLGLLFHVEGNPQQQTLNFAIERIR